MCIVKDLGGDDAVYAGQVPSLWKVDTGRF